MMETTQTVGERCFPTRQCPICRSERSRRLYRQSFALLSRASLMDGYDVVICEQCGAGFADRIPEQDVFDEYYRDLSKYEGRGSNDIEPAPVEKRFRASAELIERFVTARNSRILEIGCASGALLKALQDRGFSEVLGLDPSPGCIRAASKFYGVAGAVGTVFSIPAKVQPYDFLIMIGVMEHIRDLDRAIDQFRSRLRQGGRVYLEVPDASRYEPRLDAPFQEFSTEHINFFSRTSLTNLMVSRGFRLIEAEHTLQPQHEVTCPGIYAVFEYSSEPGTIRTDTETEPGLRAYIEGCVVEDQRIREAIQRALRPGERMIVWGVGTHTLRLLATNGLDPARIALFVDSNTKYQQQDLSGVPIVSPAELKMRSEPILISSRSSQEVIHNQIRNELGLKNPLILLYNR